MLTKISLLIWFWHISVSDFLLSMCFCLILIVISKICRHCLPVPPSLLLSSHLLRPLQRYNNINTLILLCILSMYVYICILFTHKAWIFYLLISFRLCISFLPYELFSLNYVGGTIHFLQASSWTATNCTLIKCKNCPLAQLVNI